MQQWPPTHLFQPISAPLVLHATVLCDLAPGPEGLLPAALSALSLAAGHALSEAQLLKAVGQLLPLCPGFLPHQQTFGRSSTHQECAQFWAAFTTFLFAVPAWTGWLCAAVATSVAALVL